MTTKLPSTYVADAKPRCQSLKHRGFQLGQYHVFENVSVNKEELVRALNLGVYWKRRYNVVFEAFAKDVGASPSPLGG